MKHLLLTTIAAVVLVGCGPSVDIWTATEQGDIKAVKKHLDDGVDVNEMMIVGMSPLHIASGEGHREVAELLISEGADAEANDILIGKTPLGHACLGGHKQIVELLITNGANVNAKDKVENTPLHSAATLGREEIVELLIDKGADVNANGVNGWTPLHRASTKEVTVLLISNGADVNAKRGTTPLHLATFYGRNEIAELLIDKGADVNAKIEDGRNQGKTSLDVANETNHPETADLLRKHGGKTAEELK